MNLTFHLQSSNYNPTPENRLQRVKDFAKNVVLWQKNPQAELNIQHDQFTIDDYYQQSMLLTKAFSLVHGLEHDVVSKAILEAYAKRDLRANTDDCLKIDEHGSKHVSVKHKEFSQKILDSIKTAISDSEKTENSEAFNAQAISVIENLFKDSDVIPYYLPDYIDKEKEYLHSNLPPQEGLQDKNGDLLPEALMRSGRAFETEYSIKMMQQPSQSEREMFTKLNIAFEKMIKELDMKNGINEISNFDRWTIHAQAYPSIHEELSDKHNFARFKFNDRDKGLTIQQLRVVHLCMMLPFVKKYPEKIQEEFKNYFDLIANEKFILHHVRQKYFGELRIENEFYQIQHPNGEPRYKLGIRERSCSQNSLSFEYNDDIEQINDKRKENNLAPREALKIRIPDRLRHKEDYQGYASEALETGTSFLKLPSGTTMVCMSTPFILKEHDTDFVFSAQDFKDLFKMTMSSLVVCSGHSEIDCLSILPMLFNVIRETHHVLSQRSQGIFEPIAHQNILKYIGRENTTTHKDTQYKELSLEERQKAGKLAKNYKDMIGSFLEAFYNKTDIQDLDNIDPEKDFKYKHHLFVAGETQDERVIKTWDEVHYMKELEEEFKKLKTSHIAHKKLKISNE